MTTTNIILTIATALAGGGGIAATIQWLANRGKSDAEEAEIWTRASISRLQSLHEQLEQLEERTRRLNDELESQRKGRLTCLESLQECTRSLERATAVLSEHGIVW